MTKMPIDFVWSSLPVPALLIDPNDIITETNPAAEGFFNNSGKSLCGKYIWDRLIVEAPMEKSQADARLWQVFVPHCNVRTRVMHVHATHTLGLAFETVTHDSGVECHEQRECAVAASSDTCCAVHKNVFFFFILHLGICSRVMARSILYDVYW